MSSDFGSARNGSPGKLDRPAFVSALKACGALQFGTFTLASGKTSSYYVDIKRAITRPDLLRTIATVYGGGPVGVEAIAATLNEEAQTLEEVVEPYLLKIGFLTRTPAGRRITPAALEHLDLAVGERNHAREQGQLL